MSEAARQTRPTTLPVISDAELVLRARDGDRGAQELLYQRYVRRVAGVVHRLLGSDRDLEDLVQDTFIQAFDKLRTLSEPAAFGGWVLRLATGKAVDRLRRRAMLRRIGLWSNESFDLDSLISPRAPADVALELRAVYQGIGKMPVDERVVLILRRVEELTHDEIAAQTGWSVATVKRRLSAAEARLAHVTEERR